MGLPGRSNGTRSASRGGSATVRPDPGDSAERRRRVCSCSTDFFPGDVLGYGFPNFLEMVNLGNARIKRRWIVVKAVGAALSLGAGASVGREGPIAQIGGAIGSAVAQIAPSVGRSRQGADRGRRGRRHRDHLQRSDGRAACSRRRSCCWAQTELANLTLLLIATFTAVVTSRAIMGRRARSFIRRRSCCAATGRC